MGGVRFSYVLFEEAAASCSRRCIHFFFCMFLLAPVVGICSTGETAYAGLGSEPSAYVTHQFGPSTPRQIHKWQEMMLSYAGESELEKLEAVNRFFNGLRVIDDQDHWRQRDYWATPVEFLSALGGDCEDFAIAKYYTLKAMGVSIDRMRIVYAMTVKRQQAHMVLTYHRTPDAEPLILDNLVGDIKPDSRRRDLLPVYSFNDDGLWMMEERRIGRRLTGPHILARWREMLARMEREQLRAF